MNKVICIAPHPDDETLGCGGTILKHKENGDNIYWLIITHISKKEGYGEEAISKRNKEIEAVSREYNFDEVFNLELPTTKLDIIPKNILIESISKIIKSVKPQILFLPNKSDIHSDHKVTFDATISATKSFRCPYIRKTLMYEVVSETEYAPALCANTFSPNFFSDITYYLNKKLTIMKKYESEVGVHPFPRSVTNIKALATFRGAMAGVKYAEAFTVLKEIF